MTIPVLLFASVLAAGNIPTVWSHMSGGNWTADGSAFVSYPYLAAGDPIPLDQLYFALVVNPDGRSLHLFRSHKDRSAHATEDSDEAEILNSFSAHDRAFWQNAEAEEAYASWEKRHPVRTTPGTKFGGLGTHSIRGGKEKANIDVRSDGKKCPNLTFFVELGGISGPVAEFPCRLRDLKAPATYPDTVVIAKWSPDGTRLAILWSVSSENVVFVVSRRSLASIDLLNSGAGSTDILATKLEDAGFRVGHRGKARDVHSATEVFYAPEFETEAQEVAKLVGAGSANVKPLSWKSPYAITVAVGAGR